MKKLFQCRGQTLIELILAMGLAAIILPALMAGFMSSREGKVQQGQRMQAIALLKETEQAVKSIRNTGWNNFATNGTYHPVLGSSSWSFASGTIATNGFTQEVVISDVSRNANGDIVISGGTNDPSTKKVVITIFWTQPQTSSITSTTYYTRNTNLTHTETSDTHFNAGIVTNTQVTTTLGGEVTLANNNKGKWCSPSFSTATIDLPDGPPVAVAATASATSIGIPNEAFVATSPNTSNAIKLAYIRIDADTDSPHATLSGKFTLNATEYSNASYVPTGIGLDNAFKTNDIKYYKSSSNKKYALMATDLPNKEVIAVLIDDNDSSNDTTTTGEYADPANKIFKYWTYFNTRLYAGSSQPVINTGFLSPTSNAAATGGDANGFEVTPQNANDDDANYARDEDSGTDVGTACNSSGKDRHQFYDYNITVPSGVSISGIEVRLDAWVNSISGSPDPTMCVELSWDGGTSWTSALSNTLSTSQTQETFGGSNNTWGRTWSVSDLSNANFRVRITNVAFDNTRDFRLDYAAVKVYYPSSSYDQAPHDYGATSLAILKDKGYVSSGGYLYVFDLSSIDSKTTGTSLDMLGCRIELDGFDCKPGSPAIDKKYSSGESGQKWSTTTGAAHNDCSDGGNIELNATNDIYPVETGGNTYVFAAVGGGTDGELNIVNATSVPTGSTSPTISSTSCGRISGGNASWKKVGTYDFNSNSGTEEAANSVFAKGDGSRAYITSNGGTDSKQYYILNTTSKTAPTFLSGSSSSGPSSGYYNGASPAPAANAELFPRRAMTVQNGVRAVLVGKDGVSNSNNAEEYQVLDNTTEATPTYCGGLNFDTGFNDLTSVSELDGDNYVYMVANATSNELRIIQGGPDNAIFVASGTYESPIYDAGSSVAFNNFNATVSQPASTLLKVQVASAPPVSGSCTGATFTYVGPNGDPSLYFTPNVASISGTIPFGNYLSNAYQNPQRCFKYKALMSTTDQTKTPTLYDFITNYSP